MLIGRQRELDAIRDAFLSGEPLVTLTGPGGIGKTRLARELANTSESARFVDLSAVASPGALIDEARASLGLPPGADLEVALAEQSSILVVLDDFDGLVPEAVPLLSRWLERAPEALWLITSRVRLGLAVERVIELGGLSLPATELDASDALGLFVRRAELAGAPLAPGELPFAAELVSELGGSPLAIELAASRLSVMNVRALLHRVRSDPRVLARSAGPERHRSMQAVFESSWAGLSAVEQRGLACLTVFRGGFSIDAAEAVLADVLSGADPLAVVQQLRNRSLLFQDPHARLDLPPIIRQLAQDKLGDRARAEAAHARYYLDWAARHRADAGRERHNLMEIVLRVVRAGARVERQAAENALSALWSLAPSDRSSLSLSVCQEAAAPVLEKSEGSGARPELFARGIFLRGEALWEASRSDAAVADFARAEAMAGALGDAELQRAAVCRLAQVALERERFDEARTLLERAPSGDVEVEALVAIVAARAGDSRARTLLDRAAERARARGDAECAARLELELARVALDGGAHAVALQRLEALANTESATRAEAEALAARIAADAGRLDDAIRSLEGAAAELRALGRPHDAARIAVHTAAALREAGRSALAHVLLRDALPWLGSAPPSERALAHQHLAALEAEAGDDQAAAHHRDAAIAAHAPTARSLIAEPEELARANDARFRAFARAARRPDGTAAPPDDALLIATDGTWFRAPHGARVSLEKRRPLARLLRKLADAHASGAAEVLRDDLISAGWPGERILPSAAAHRVRVAVSTLRKLGLGELVVTTEGGYALSAAARPHSVS